MKWIILIGNENLTLNKLLRIEHIGAKQMYFAHPKRLVVEYENEHIFYDYVENLSDEYKSGELDVIPYKEPKFIMMVYKSETLVNAVLEQDNFLSDIYIDNDLGRILPIREFVEQIEEQIFSRQLTL